MREYVFPAVFHPNDDGSFTVTYPDLPGCITEGKTPADAVHMAQAALTQWIEYLTDKGQAMPEPSDPDSVTAEQGGSVKLIRAGRD